MIIVTIASTVTNKSSPRMIRLYLSKFLVTKSFRRCSLSLSSRRKDRSVVLFFDEFVDFCRFCDLSFLSLSISSSESEERSET